MVTFKSTQILGDVICKNVNDLVMTAIPKDNKDESGFIIPVNVELPLRESCVPTFFLKEINKSKTQPINVNTYAKAIMPDWIEITDETKEVEQNTNLYPKLEDVKIDFVDQLSYCSNRFVDVVSSASILGKSGKSIYRSKEIFVEYTDKSNAILSDVMVYDLNPVYATVVTDEDAVIGDSITSSSNVIKSINVVSNKNNFIDLYIDLEGIVSISNLPNGLSYKNKHISGIPLKSGKFVSTINFDSNITDTQSYTIRFNIPELQRIM